MKYQFDFESREGEIKWGKNKSKEVIKVSG